MAIKIYSDRTNQFYNSVDEANRAEFELKEKENLAKIEKERKERELKEKKEKATAERKAAAEVVENARKAYLEAQKAYREALENFCGKYGTYHYTVENGEEIPSLFDWFGKLLTF
jgi:hypothetical protein